MRTIKHLLLFLLLGMFAASSVFAQEEEDRNTVPPRLQEQQELYEGGDYLFPAQKRSNWSIGLAGGTSFVSGDVKAQPGWGAALEVRKALGHVFSLRFQSAIGQAKGLNYQSSRGYYNHGNNPWHQNYTTSNTDPFNPTRVYYNFKTTYGDLFLQGVVNLNNVNFYKEQSKWNVFVSAGIGGMAYRVKVDALDASGNPYDFSNVPQLSSNNTLFNFSEARRMVINELRDNILDGEYESLAEGHTDEQGIKLGTDANGNDRYFVVNPALSGSAGFRFRLSRRLDLSLEHRIVWTNDDLIDGQRWAEWPAGTATAETGDADLYQTTLIGLNFRLGPGEESMWWTNPLTESYRNNANIKDKLDKLDQDSDGDGIADLFDKEPDTPDDAIVDGQGRTLDTDADGYPDYLDEEPFSPKGAQVNNKGVAYDADNDGVPDIFDVEPNTEPGYLVDVKGRAIKFPEPPKPAEPVVSTANCSFPSIHFDLDKDKIKPEFYPELYYVARVMREDPGLLVQLSGHTDNRNSDTYNMNLSQRRAENVKNFLIKNFGIASSRIQIDYKGETTPIVSDLPDNRNPKFEPMHYLNRRVEVTCVNR